jgi:RNA polymerase sigma-70 factor (ECF subfamily)
VFHDSAGEPAGSLDVISVRAGEDTAETVIATQSLRQALQSLTSAHRAILNELYLKGRSVQDTARSLGVPVGTVRSRAHYAMRSLRHAISCPA